MVTLFKKEASLPCDGSQRRRNQPMPYFPLRPSASRVKQLPRQSYWKASKKASPRPSFKVCWRPRKKILILWVGFWGVMHGRWQRQLSLTKHERRDYWPKTPCIDADKWKSRTIRVTKRPKFIPATHQAYAQKSLTMCYLRHANRCLYAIDAQDFPGL